MRVVVLIVGLLLPVAARAQVEVLAPAPPPAVNQDGMKDFCVYGNQIYSLGAQLCVPRSNAGMRCVASDGAKSGGRAYWSFENLPSSGWRCGSGG